MTPYGHFGIMAPTASKYTLRDFLKFPIAIRAGNSNHQDRREDKFPLCEVVLVEIV